MNAILLLALLSPQADDPYAWFDALGYPDLKTLPFIRVYTGQSHKAPGRDPEPDTREAFLLHDAGKTFTVLGLHLERNDLEKRSTGPIEERIGYERIDLAKAARDRLDALAVPPRDDERGFRSRPPAAVELFILARACDRQGQAETGRDLLNAAAALPDRRTGEKSPRTVAERVADEIALGRVWQAVRDFGDPAIPRKKLLETFSEIGRKFPKTEHAELVRDTVRMLETMVQEDAAHVEPKQPPATLPPQARVKELIFHLRDQNGAQYSQPGECDFFADPRNEESPAHRLAALGFDAVPLLIDALEDARFTRSVGYHRDFYFSHHVLRVGDAALAVLEKIAGKRFFERAYTNGAMTKDEAAKATKTAVQEWWKELQAKGEKQVLIEAAEKGDLPQARRLLEKHPEDALAALTKALAAASGPRREPVIELIVRIRGRESGALLLAELKSGPHAGTRMTAARELIRWGDAEVPGLLIEEWKRSATAKRNRDEDFFERPTQRIIAALAATHKPEPLRAMAADFAKRPLDDRMSVLSGISAGCDFFSLEHAEEEGGNRPPGVTAEDEAACARIAEDLLAAALDDVTVQEGRSASNPTVSFSDPRVCDAAAHILAFRWPKQYTFNIGANRKLRDRQIAEARNVWRRSRGQEALPLPEEKARPSLAAEAVDPLVDAVLRGDAGSEEALVSKGLPALKATQARLDTLDKTHGRRHALEESARRLGCIVSETKLSPVPADNGAAFDALVKGLEGQPLAPQSLRTFVEKAVTIFPQGVVGFNLTVDREADLSGVRVVVETVTETVPKGSSVAGWAMSEIVELGTEGLLHHGGGGRKNYATGPEGWKMLQEPVEQVFASPATKPFSIRISRIRKE
ncbi:MAG TPA: hypothetical protein VE981_22105 [Planctomycetota bacterium]|nr:hypothetical protein [Planctomycetota bacterium]